MLFLWYPWKFDILRLPSPLPVWFFSGIAQYPKNMEQKKREEKKRFWNGWGLLGQGVGALKREVGWSTLANYDNLDKLSRLYCYRAFISVLLAGALLDNFKTLISRNLHNIRTEVSYEMSNKSLPSPITNYYFIPSSPQQLFRQEINVKYSKPKMEKVLLTFYKFKF